MKPWLVRGVAMAVVNAAAQTVLAKMEITHPSNMSVLRPITLAILVGVALLWGGIDGWLRLGGRRPGMAWFYGALVGGVLAGLLGVIGQAIFVDQTGVWALGSALTGGAAFTALLILVPAALGLQVGKHLDASGKAARNRPLDDDPDQAGPTAVMRGTLTADRNDRNDRNGDRRPRPRPYPRRPVRSSPRG